MLKLRTAPILLTLPVHLLCQPQPQGQLTVSTDLAVDEVLQHCRYVAPFKHEAAQYFVRDGARNILGSIGLGVEHDHTQRITELSPHQIGDGGLIVGAAKIGLCERCAEPAKVVATMY